MTLGLLLRRHELDPEPPSRGSLPEDVLVAAYAGASAPPRVEPCACGGVVVAADLASSMAAVRAHQITPGHAAWWAREEAR